MQKKELTQQQRLLLLAIDVAVLCFTSYLSFGSLIPPFGDSGFWFYTALLSILLGNRLVTPFFIKPADALSYSIPAFIALLLVNHWTDWDLTARALFSIATIYSIVITGLAVFSISLKDSASPTWYKAGDIARYIVDDFGDPRPIYGLMLVFALYTFHLSAPRQMFFITVGTLFTVELRPFDRVLLLGLRVLSQLKEALSQNVIAEIAAYQVPGIVLLRQLVPGRIQPKSLIQISDPRGPVEVGMVLDYVGRDDALLIRAIAVDTPEHGLASLEGTAIQSGKVVSLEDASLEKIFAGELPAVLQNRAALVGVVGTDTSVDKLFFEVTDSQALEQGQLVEVPIGDDEVLYQIVNGLTKEEIVFQKNSFGFVRAQGHRIGIWDHETEVFEPSKWLPHLNTPVFLKTAEHTEADADAVGYFPNTDYFVRVSSVDDLVTHNTAILGILGIGKSMLSLELVERMLAEDIKVVCLDLTDEYADELKDYIPVEAEKAFIEELNKIGAAGKKNIKKNVEEGGSINQVSERIQAEINRFLDPKSEQKLKIINPADIEVWRQDSKPFGDDASMASLTACELTKLITEAVLTTAQAQGRTKKARVCIVYEEAHTLVPEWNSAAAEGDKSATNATARAILQGRKYGMGCLLITQRTANVTKTILNQCNTVFAMRTFDDTGKNFLANYIGQDYTDILPSLAARHAVFYGKASSCNNPVLLRLNDRDAFTAAFRGEHKPKKA